MIRLLYHVPIWFLYLFLVKVPVNFAGLFMVPFLWQYRRTDYKDLPWWTRLWSNMEDWQAGTPGYSKDSLPIWWVKREGTSFWDFWRYHAIRNGGDGLRTVAWASAVVDPDKLEYYTPRYFTWYEPWKLREYGVKWSFYFTWQGLKGGMKFLYIHDDELHTVFQFGWRMEPSDVVAPKHELGRKESFSTKLLVRHIDQTKAKDYDK